MISSEVQRTLVKSPPELWAELSDPASLARHLGELGEIRIVRTEPESTVEWVSENTSGVVSIKPSGWGTKVTLSVTRQLSEPEQADTTAESVPAVEGTDAAPKATDPPLSGESESSPEVQPDSSAEPESESSADVGSESSVEAALTSSAGVGSESSVEAELKGETPAVSHTETAAAAPTNEPKPRRGFFARLFSRRRSSVPAAEAPAADHTAADNPVAGPDAFAAVTQALAPDSIAATHPFAAPAASAAGPLRQAPSPPDASAAGAPGPAADASADAMPEPEAPAADAPVDISAELMAAEEVSSAEVTAEEVTAMLTAVLDRLGAAHHRPFSRA